MFKKDFSREFDWNHVELPFILCVENEENILNYKFCELFKFFSFFAHTLSQWTMLLILQQIKKHEFLVIHKQAEVVVINCSTRLRNCWHCHISTLYVYKKSLRRTMWDYNTKTTLLITLRHIRELSLREPMHELNCSIQIEFILDLHNARSVIEKRLRRWVCHVGWITQLLYHFRKFDDWLHFCRFWSNCECRQRHFWQNQDHNKCETTT